MKVKRSKAEDLIFIELQNRGLTDKLYSLESVIVLDRRSPLRGQIIPKERFMRDMIPVEKGEGPKFTVPDVIVRTTPPSPCYADGPPHLKRGNKIRDDMIDDELNELGYPFHRFPYKGDLERQPTRLNQICDEIETLCQEEYK